MTDASQPSRQSDFREGMDFLETRGQRLVSRHVNAGPFLGNAKAWFRLEQIHLQWSATTVPDDEFGLEGQVWRGSSVGM